MVYGLVTVLLALNLFLGARVYMSSAHAGEQKDSAYANEELFDQVMERVRTEYVNGTNMTYRSLVYSALKGMVGSLDPHSEFLDPDDYQQLQGTTPSEGHVRRVGPGGAGEGWLCRRWFRRWMIHPDITPAFCPVTALQKSTG